MRFRGFWLVVVRFGPFWPVVVRLVELLSGFDRVACVLARFGPFLACAIDPLPALTTLMTIYSAADDAKTL